MSAAPAALDKILAILAADPDSMDENLTWAASPRGTSITDDGRTWYLVIPSIGDPVWVRLADHRDDGMGRAYGYVSAMDAEDVLSGELA